MNPYLIRGSTAINSMAIGNNARCYASESLAFGDNTIAVHENEVVVGVSLFNKPIAASLIEYVKTNPADFKEFIRTIINTVQK